MLNGVCRFAGVPALLLSPLLEPVGAQKTGALSSATIGESRPRMAWRAASVDPSLTSASRASGWSVVVAHEEDNEARVQINVCDALPICTKHWKSDLTLAGPIDTKAHFTELANFDGLIGKSRVSTGVSYTNSTEFPFAEEWTTYGRFTFARPVFDFRAPSNLEERKRKHSIFSLEAGGSRTFHITTDTHDVIFAASVGGRYEDSFASADSRNVCAPAGFGPPGTLTCDDLIVGEPTRSKKRISTSELKFGLSGGVGARIKVDHDLQTDVSRIDIPVYLIPDGNGGIGGGIRAIYMSNTGKIVWSVFVSSLKF